MKKQIILLGAGGQCKACVDVIETEGKFVIAGIIDKKGKLHQKILGYEIIGCDEDLPEFAKKYKYFLVTIGQVKSADKRAEKYEYLKSMNVKLPVIVSPFSYVSKHASIGEGTIIQHNVIVNAGAKIGKNCIINNNAVIEHDAVIGDHCHISTGSIVNGECIIGEKTLIGSSSVIIQCVKIADNTIIGAGSVVIKSVTESGVYAGAPAKRIVKDMHGYAK